LVEANSSSQPISYQGGQNAAVTSAIGQATLQGGNQTGAGGAASAGGNTVVQAGNNAGTNAASTSGSTEIASGQSTAGGLQGLTLISSFFVKGGGTSTLWNLQCLVSQMTINDCGASPSNIIGVALQVNSTTVGVHRLASQTPVNASSAVVVGHTVCAGATAGKITDSGGTGGCPGNFTTIGIVESVSGTYTLPISGAVTLSTTLPLIEIDRTVGSSGSVESLATLATGTVTVNTTAACTPATVGCIYSFTHCGTNASTTIGTLSLGTVVAGTSFVINSLTATNTVATTDVSTVCYAINP
jgi:hypothetical protein